MNFVHFDHEGGTRSFLFLIPTVILSFISYIRDCPFFENDPKNKVKVHFARRLRLFRVDSKTAVASKKMRKKCHW